MSAAALLHGGTGGGLRPGLAFPQAFCQTDIP